MKEHHNPWQRLSTKEIYQNPWIEVYEDQVINPAGGNGIYGRICFKNKAIGIIPLDEQQNTWLVGQYRYMLDEYCWEIPMGGGAKNASPLESAMRELKEETGFTAQQWTMIMRIHTSNSVTDEEGFIYLAQGLQAGETDFDDTEELAIRKLPFGEVLEMVMEGKITDGISIAGILKAARILNY